MPLNIRAFIVVIVVAVIVFAIMAKPAQAIIPAADFRRWRNLWLAITSTAFLVGNFWVLMFVTGLFVLATQTREITKPALYWLLLCVIPVTARQIPGFGLINYLFELNMPRLLALVILLPALIFAGNKRSQKTGKSPGPDNLIILFFLLSAALSFRGTTPTDAMRDIAMMFLGIILPYFAFSRNLASRTDIERTMMAFLLPMFVLGILGGFEAAKTWKLYSLPDISGSGTYLRRAGTLRAVTSTGNSIVFGYTMMIAIGFLLPLASRYLTRMQSFMAFGALGMGLLSSLSRGPWVGAVILLVLYISSGRNAAKKLVTMGFAGIMLLPFLALTPFWQKVVNLIPFIGTIETENIDYRQRLFEQSWIVINRNPWFGSVDYLSTPEMQAMIQGQGIIDLVNTYIQVALEFGFVGLFLFVSFFCLVLIRLRTAYRSLPPEETEMIQIGRAIFAILVAVLVTIATVSKISIIPYLYWSLSGLAVAYIHVTRKCITKAKAKSTPQTINLVPQA
jgi:O-antigen ligase